MATHFHICVFHERDKVLQEEAPGFYDILTPFINEANARYCKQSRHREFLIRFMAQSKSKPSPLDPFTSSSLSSEDSNM